MKTNICPVCGEGSLKKEIIEERFTYKGQSTTIPNYIVYRCNLCGEAIVDKQTLKSSGKQLKNFKCKVDGLLTGDQIKDIRRRLGLTQEQMSELLGGGLKSFARYEAGKICQSKAMDNLLRILDKFPQMVQFIQETSEGKPRFFWAFQGIDRQAATTANSGINIIHVSIGVPFYLLPTHQVSEWIFETIPTFCVRRTVSTTLEIKDRGKLETLEQ